MRLLIALIPIVFLAIVILLSACSPTTVSHGVPNLVTVEPGVWRSGQPNAEGWAYLKSLGVTRVVKLNFESEGSDAAAAKLGLEVVELSIEPEGDKDIWDNVEATFVKPNAATIEKAVAEISKGGGVLVHCTHGQDRTGLVVGAYRVSQNAWTKERAFREMIANHFHPELVGLLRAWEDVAERPGALP